MPAAVRLTDKCTGHGPCAPRPNIEASPNVFYNNLGAHRLTDGWAIHCLHGAQQASGSPNVFVNNLAQARIGDDVSCGSKNAQGSPNVFVNG